MASLTPGLKLKVDNKLSEDGGQMAVDLAFKSIEDFEPARVAQQVPALRALLETRSKLRDLMSKVDRSEELESLLEQVLKNDNEMKSLSSQLGLGKQGNNQCPAPNRPRRQRKLRPRKAFPYWIRLLRPRSRRRLIKHKIWLRTCWNRRWRGRLRSTRT